MHSSSLDPISHPAAPWRGTLALGFEQRGGRSILARNQHRGPLRVLRSFQGTDGVCEAIIVHPPGGVVGGDILELQAHVASGARALLTTPAANKFYRSAGATAQVTQTLRVAPGARLEWMPQETLVFAGARARQTTQVSLTGDATFAGWEIVCWGRPASAERFTQGDFQLSIELWRDEVPLLLERLHLVEQSSLLEAAWGLRGAPVMGTFIMTAEAALQELMEIPAAWRAHGQAAVTALPGVLVGRYLGHHVAEARALFTAWWTILRPQAWAMAAQPPRIWAT